MSFNMYIKLNLSNENKQLGNKQYGKLENENEVWKINKDFIIRMKLPHLSKKVFF